MAEDDPIGVVLFRMLVLFAVIGALAIYLINVGENRGRAIEKAKTQGKTWIKAYE